MTTTRINSALDLSRHMHMLHHLSFAVSDIARSAVFYDATLSALGYVRVFADEAAVGYGSTGGEDKFAIKLRSRGVMVPGDGFHVAFSAPSQRAVDRFYRAALDHGGRDNGGSGFHPEYGKNYYAAFVLDPDGYRVEAVINEKVQLPDPTPALIMPPARQPPRQP